MSRCAFVAVSAFLISVSPALAQNTRTFVSVLGNDANPCTNTQPCRTLQRAHDATQSGGTLVPLTAGGYGPVTINRAIKIVNNGVGTLGIFAASGGNGVTINAGASDHIILEGLTVDGLGLDQTNGIVINSAGGVAIFNCTVTDMKIAPNGAAGTGVLFNVASGVDFSFVISGSIFDSNQFGVQVKGGANYHSVVEKSIFRGNSAGFAFNSGSGSVTLDNITAVGHSFAAIIDNGNVTTSLHLTRSEITGNQVGISGSANGGLIFSHGDNRISSNITDQTGGGIHSNLGLQ